MRRRATRAAVLLGGCGFALAGTLLAPAGATSCAMLSAAEHMARADAVFVGTASASAADQDTVVVAVSDVYKGAVPNTTPVVAERDMGSSQEFVDGQQYVFFADDREGSLVSPICSGTAPVDDAVLSELEAASSDRSAYRPAPADPTAPRAVPTPVDATGGAVASAETAPDGTEAADDVGSVSPLLVGAVIAALVALVVYVPGFLRRRARKDSVTTTP